MPRTIEEMRERLAAVEREINRHPYFTARLARLTLERATLERDIADAGSVAVREKQNAINTAIAILKTARPHTPADDRPRCCCMDCSAIMGALRALESV